MQEQQRPGGRPVGEISTVLMRQFEALAEVKGHATWRDAAQAGCVGYRMANLTTKNLVKLGKLEPVADVPVPGSKRPMKGYRPRKAGGWVTGGLGLCDVMKGWVTV
jgi:hypothetical protein